MTCAHAETTPVDVRDHRTGGTETVARICDQCLDRLPDNWGCHECAWSEIKSHCGRVLKVVESYRCETHRKVNR